MTELKIDPKQIASALLWVVMVLSLLNGVLLGLHFYLGDSELDQLVEYFDFDIEGNIPTLYSALTVLLCSGLLALIARVNWHRPGGRRYHWLGLSVLFFFLALDEGAAIHEQLSDVLEQYMAAEGALFFLWVIPYGIVTVVLAFVYLKFLWELPTVTRTRFIVAGLLFVGGALGVEMLSGIAADRHGYDSVSYTVLYTIEEMLEMLGIVLFIYALLSYLAQEGGGFALRLPALGAETAAARADALAVEAAIRAMFQRFQEHDPAGVEAALHPDCTVWDVFVPELIVGVENRRRFHADDQAQAQARGPLTMELDTPVIDVWGDTAVARYCLSFRYEPPNALTGEVRITSVLRRAPGRWVIVHHHEGLQPSGVPSIRVAGSNSR